VSAFFFHRRHGRDKPGHDDVEGAPVDLNGDPR